MINFSTTEKAFNKISLRERGFIFSALVICVVSISYFWIWDPAIIKHNKAEKVLHGKLALQEQLDNEIAEVKIRLQQDPLSEINSEIATSLQTLAALEQQLDDKLVKFIDARKMPQALTKVLSQSPGVKVVSLTTLPVSAFNTANSNDQGESKEDSKTPHNSFYKHTLEVKLTGSYNAIYQYFLNLEAIPEKFYWSVLTYSVGIYPKAEVMIQIYTVSEQQDLVSG